MNLEFKMENNEKAKSDISLRSEKVRMIIGEIPTSLVRWSIVIMTIVLVLLITCVCVLPYPYTEDETILIHLLNRIST